MSDTDESGRTQPEFSTGERLAALESLLRTYATSAELHALSESMHGHWRLDQSTEQASREEIQALRRELSASIIAQKEAINKAEEAQLRQAELTREQTDRRETVTNERLLALERGESAGEGAHARGQQITTNIIGWLTVVIIAVGLLIKFA